MRSSHFLIINLENALREQTPTRGDIDNVMVDAPATPDELGEKPTQTMNMRSVMAHSALNGSNGTTSKPAAAKDDFGTPGSSWNNKKAKEEYEQAASKLIDSQWNMSRLN